MYTKTNNRNFNPDGKAKDFCTKKVFMCFYPDFRDGISLIVAKDHHGSLVAESEAFRDLLQSLRELDLHDVANTAIKNLAEKGFVLPDCQCGSGKKYEKCCGEQ